MTALRLPSMISERFRSVADFAVPVGFLAAAAICGFAIAIGKIAYLAIAVGGILALILLQLPAIAIWLVLLGSLAISGPLAFFVPSLAKLPWLFSLLTMFLLGASIVHSALRRHSPAGRLPGFVPLFAVFLVYTAVSVLWNDSGLTDGMSGLKRVAQGSGVMFALATIPFTPRSIRRWIYLILVLSVLNLPFALYQRVVLSQILEGGADAIVGLLELDQKGRGASGVLALMQMMVVGGILSFGREALLKWRTALILIALVIAPLLFSETNVIFLLTPLVVLTVYADLVRRRPMLFVFGLTAFVALFIALGGAYLIWQQYAWTGGETVSIEKRIEKVIAYNFGDAGYNDQGDLNRNTVYSYWAKHNGLHDPVTWAFGYGVGSTNIYGDSKPILTLRHAGKSLGLVTISQYLWELGIVGTGLYLLAYWSALMTALRRLRRSAPGFDRALDRSLLTAVAVCGIGLVYNASLSGILSGQVLAALVLGLIAWRERQASAQRRS